MAHEKFTDAELENLADSIMDRFNFEKVLNHMQEKNHQWLIDGGMAIPDIDRLRSSARSLLTQAIYHDSHCVDVGTGGFVAYKMPWGLQLTFQLAWA